MIAVEGEENALGMGVHSTNDVTSSDAVVSVYGALVDRGIARYDLQDSIASTLYEHGVQRGLLNVMFEIRHDLIADPLDQADMATESGNTNRRRSATS